MKSNSKQTEVIYAGAIGDAFGYLIEFDSWEQIQNKYGKNGLQYNSFKNLSYRVSDDTQMTLFCWNALLNKLKEQNINLDELNQEIYQQYLNWYITQDIRKYSQNYSNPLMKYKEIWNAEAPGRTCLSALGSGKMGTIKRHINDSKGCGGIMRVAPISFLEISNKDIFELGSMQAAITHGHPDGYLSAGFFASFLNRLIKGCDFDESYHVTLNILKEYNEAENLINYLEKVIKLINKNEILKHNDLTQEIGFGWVGEEALGIALYAIKKAKSFEDLLDISANHGGDSDSTASLAAQLYVAQNGLEDKYKEIFSEINLKEVINYLVMRQEQYQCSKKEINENNNETKEAAQNNFHLRFIKNLFSNIKKR